MLYDRTHSMPDFSHLMHDGRCSSPVPAGQRPSKCAPTLIVTSKHQGMRSGNGQPYTSNAVSDSSDYRPHAHSISHVEHIPKESSGYTIPSGSGVHSGSTTGLWRRRPWQRRGIFIRRGREELHGAWSRGGQLCGQQCRRVGF